MEQRSHQPSTLVRALFHNAIRLGEDAKYLNEGGRHESALVLSILAIEEVGRAILQAWEWQRPLPKASKWISYHVKKQAAVAHLLWMHSSSQLLDRGRTEQLSEEIASTWITGAEAHWWVATMEGKIEIEKHSCLYVDSKLVSDEALKEPVTTDMVLTNLHRVADALQILLNPKVRGMGLNLARAFYESWLTGKSIPELDAERKRYNSKVVAHG